MPYKVILAEASPSVQKVVQMAFSEPEFEVHTIEDGRQAIESLTRVNPDAVLLSLALPSRDGYEVGRYLRSREEFQKAGLVRLKNSFQPEDQVEGKIRSLLRDEILSVERELEKRLKASLRTEFKEWLDREKK